MRLALVLAAALLTGCQGDDPAHLLADYHARVARVLDTEMQAPEHLQPPLILPGRGQRTRAIPEHSISFWQYLQTWRCDVHTLISERNSPLGRVMPESRRLYYEVRLINGLERCAWQEFPEDTERRTLLLGIAADKRRQLPDVLWNATFASAEFSSFASIASQPLPLDAGLSLEAAHQALAHLRMLDAGLRQAADGPLPEPEIARLEHHLQQLARSRAGGGLSQSLYLLARELDAVATTLNTALEQRPPCPQGRPTPRGRNLSNVLEVIYRDQVQPYISLVDRRGGAVSRELAALAEQEHVENHPDFQRFLQHNLLQLSHQGLWSAYRDALERHTTAWQAILGSCQLLPGT